MGETVSVSESWWARLAGALESWWARLAGALGARSYLVPVLVAAYLALLFRRLSSPPRPRTRPARAPRARAAPPEARLRALSFANGRAVEVWEGSGRPLGTAVWDGALLAADLFSRGAAGRGAAWWAGRRVLELGSGTGVVGLLLAGMGAEVRLTDLPPLLPLLRRNAARAGRGLGVEVAALEWGGDGAGAAEGAWDAVVGADVLYVDEDAFKRLLDTLKGVARASPGVEIFLSGARRHHEGEYLARLADSFVVEDLRGADERKLRGEDGKEEEEEEAAVADDAPDSGAGLGDAGPGAYQKAQSALRYRGSGNAAPPRRSWRFSSPEASLYMYRLRPRGRRQ